VVFQPRNKAGKLLPDVVAAAYGGAGVDYSTLCIPNPAKVKLSEDGFRQIAAQRNATRMATFVARIVEHLGASVADKESLLTFSGQFSTPDSQLAYPEIFAMLSESPAWVRWPTSVSCVADRLASASDVGTAIGWACQNMPEFNCSSEIPAACTEDVWALADYVFSTFYSLQGTSARALEHCYFGGAAALAGPERLGLLMTRTTPCGTLSSTSFQLSSVGLGARRLGNSEVISLDGEVEDGTDFTLLALIMAVVAASSSCAAIFALRRRGGKATDPATVRSATATADGSTSPAKVAVVIVDVASLAQQGRRAGKA